VKILHVVDGLGTGGTETMLLNVLPRLSTDNTVVSLTGFNTTGKKLEAAGTRVYYLDLKKSGRNLVSAIVAFQRIVTREKPGIINSYIIQSNLFARLFGRLSGCSRIICSIRNRRIDKPFMARLDRLTSRLVTRYTVNSPVIKDFMLDKGFDEAKITVIPNGIDVEAFRTRQVSEEDEAREMRQAMGLKEKFCFVTVASLTRKKGLGCLLSAIAGFRAEGGEAVFLLAGDGPEKERLLSRARRLGIEHSVRFLGRRDDVPALLSMADAFVLPSVHEGMCNALLEAMAAGTPIVCSDIPENEWVIGNAGLLSKAGNAESLCACLKKAYSSPELRKRLAAAASRRVQEWFPLEKTVRLYENLYREQV